MQHLARALSLALAFVSSVAIAQEPTLAGLIVDQSGAPVAYANVYFPAAGTGTVTGEDGRFGFAAFAKTVGPFDTLVVSSIGFRDTVLTVRKIRGLRGAPVVLAKAAYELASPEVSGDRIRWGNRERIGARIRRPFLSMCVWSRAEIGAELVVGIDNGGRRRVEAVTIQPEMLSGDSALVEVNVYRLSDSGAPTAALQRVPVRTTLKRSRLREDHTVDLSASPVVVDGDFAIGIEPLVFYSGGEIIAPRDGLGVMLRTPCSDRRSRRLRSYLKREDGTWSVSAIGGGVYAYGRREE